MPKVYYSPASLWGAFYSPAAFASKSLPLAKNFPQYWLGALAGLVLLLLVIEVRYCPREPGSIEFWILQDRLFRARELGVLVAQIDIYGMDSGSSWRKSLKLHVHFIGIHGIYKSTFDNIANRLLSHKT